MRVTSWSPTPWPCCAFGSAVVTEHHRAGKSKGEVISEALALKWEAKYQRKKLTDDQAVQQRLRLYEKFAKDAAELEATLGGEDI